MDDFNQKTDELNENKETLNEVKETKVESGENQTAQGDNRVMTAPTSEDIRWKARDVLKGNWTKALGISAVALAIVMVITYLTNMLVDWSMLPIVRAQYYGLPMDVAMLITPFLVIIPALLVISLIASLQEMVIARVTRNLATNEKIGFSLIRLNLGDLFKGFRMTWVMAWRAMFIPLLWMILIAVIDVVLIEVAGLPAELHSFIRFVTMIAVMVMMLRRLLYYIPMFQMWVIDPAASARELANRSKELMKDNRWRLFCLDISFFGWTFLGAVVKFLIEEMLGGLMDTTVGVIFTEVWNFVLLPLSVYMATAVAVFVRDLMERKGMSFGAKEGLAEEKTAE